VRHVPGTWLLLLVSHIRFGLTGDRNADFFVRSWWRTLNTVFFLDFGRNDGVGCLFLLICFLFITSFG
jgi:hypothetical protein